jgi:uncharacterized protein YyaL (SSP411 family)
MTTAIATSAVRYPTSFGIWASLILKITYGIKELAITGNNFSDFRNQLLQLYMPGKILQSGFNENKSFPMLNGKNSGAGTLIFFCRQYSCKTPVTSIEKLLIQIKEDNKI